MELKRSHTDLTAGLYTKLSRHVITSPGMAEHSSNGRERMSSRRQWLNAAGVSLTTLPTADAQSEHDWSGRNPVRYPDASVINLDPAFAKYRITSAAVERVCTGFRWAEGPAWNGAGNYLVWSDIPNNRQMRWLEEDSHVSEFRKPSNYSNGNTFDWQGRQL